LVPGDARWLYAIIAALKPRHMLEVGSGNSTMFASKAIRDFGLLTHLFSIDPAPRVGIDRLCDELHRESVLTVPLETFDRLGPSDILFIDGSHLVLNGSDTTRLFLVWCPINNLFNLTSRSAIMLSDGQT
jgi:hypothetical protein